MGIKDKILNSIANRLNRFSTPTYDRIHGMDVKGEVKGVLTTYDCTYQKILKEKEQSGIISIETLLENEFGDSKLNNIYFCDNNHIIALHNSSKDTYVEPVYECFDNAYKITYLVCETENSYNNVKFYIEQNSKYHTFLKNVDDIPYERAYNDLFSENAKSVNVETIKNSKENLSKQNCFEMKGKILSMGPEFVKKDKLPAQFIIVEQEYDFKGKTKKNIMPVMLEKEVLDCYRSSFSINDNVSIKGSINSYKDKQNQDRIVVNCTELELLNTREKKDAER